MQLAKRDLFRKVCLIQLAFDSALESARFETRSLFFAGINRIKYEARQYLRQIKRWHFARMLDKKKKRSNAYFSISTSTRTSFHPDNDRQPTINVLDGTTTEGKKKNSIRTKPHAITNDLKTLDAT